MNIDFHFARYFTDAEWDNSGGVNAADFLAFKAKLNPLKAEFPEISGTVYTFRVLGDDLDKQLKLETRPPQLPQLLFSTPGGDGNATFLAKLVQDQINVPNIRTMLKALQNFKPDGAGHFFDPSLNIGAIGWNPAEAPTASGLSFLAINPWTQDVKIDRFGQQFGNLLHGAIKLLPFAIGLYLLNKLSSPRASQST